MPHDENVRINKTSPFWSSTFRLATDDGQRPPDATATATVGASSAAATATVRGPPGPLTAAANVDSAATTAKVAAATRCHRRSRVFTTTTFRREVATTILA